MRSLAVAAQQAINNTEKEKALVTAALVARQLQVLLLCCALLCRWQIPLKSKTKHLKYEQTLIVITHNEDIAQMGNRKLVIADGKVVEQ